MHLPSCSPSSAASPVKRLRVSAALLALAWLPALAQPDEVPFITSPDNVTLEMLQIAGVGAKDHVIDLGSGDGRIVIVAAKRFGASGEGVEIVPDLVARSQASARDAGVADRVTFHQKDLFTMDLGAATVVTMYLLPEFNLKLRPTLLALKPGTRIVSHDWDMGDWQPDRTVVVPVPNKQVGMEKSSKVHFWVVPAQIHGLWCGAGLLNGATLKLVQRFQSFDGTLVHRKRTRELSGRIDGSLLTTASKRGDLTLEVKDGEMRLASAEGVLALARGSSFKRAAGSSCP